MYPLFTLHLNILFAIYLICYTTYYKKKKTFHYLINSNKTQILIVIDLLQNAHLLQCNLGFQNLSSRRKKREGNEFRMRALASKLWRNSSLRQRVVEGGGGHWRWWMGLKMKFRGEANSIHLRVTRAENLLGSQFTYALPTRQICEGNKLRPRS